MGPAELGLMVVTGGLGFVLADGLDRLLATYNPSAAEKPKDLFVADGAGTLANTLNIASMPGWKRVAAGVGTIAVPAVGAAFVDNAYGKAALEGLAVGAGISAFKTLWNNVVMPLLLGKDTSTPALQKSYIARLYPAEVAAHINHAAQKTGGNAAGMLSDAQTGVAGPGDVGPFALAGDSPYPDAARALRHEAGMGGDSPYPNADQALRHQAGMGGDSPYASAADSLRHGVGYEPGPPPGTGPGPQAEPHTDCGCVGDPTARFTAFLGDQAVEQ